MILNMLYSSLPYHSEKIIVLVLDSAIRPEYYKTIHNTMVL